MFSPGQSLLLKGLLLIGMSGALTHPVVALPDSHQPPATQSAGYSASELDLLFKPVALYPDPLLAQLLPAAAFPAQIAAAAQWLKANPQGDVDSQPWDASVRALAHYPEVIDQLSHDLAWTEAMGHASATQMSDVTSSLQRLRTQAYAAGNLQSNEQQTVTTDESYITIQPTSPQTIYVPVYNPSLAYSPSPLGWEGSLISFGLGYGCGSWLSYGFDWYGRSCFRYPRGFYYGSYCGPRYNNVSYIHNTYNVGNCNSWRPNYGQSYSSYNQCYRPGNSWTRLPGCGSGTGWNQNNFYRPGGNWSSHVGSGWNQPGSQAPSNWTSNGGGNWSRSQARGSNQSNNGWSNSNNGWSSQGSYQPGYSRSSNGFNQSRGQQGYSRQSNWNQGSNSWTGNNSNGGNWGRNSSGWSGGGRHSSGSNFPSGGGFTPPQSNGGNWGQNSSGWSGGGRHSSGLSFPSGGGFTSPQSNGGGHWNGGGHQSSGGFNSQHSNGGGNWNGGGHQSSGGGFTSPQSNGGGHWNGGGHQSSGGFNSQRSNGGGNWNGGGGHGRNR